MGHKRFGLIGRGIGHSFSASFFNDKFKKEGLDCSYHPYDLSSISLLPSIIQDHLDLKGLNVTSPYKREVIPYLDKLSPEAELLQAVNVIEIERTRNGRLILTGHNTDSKGFELTIPELGKSELSALVMGTGGASSAVVLALQHRNIDYKVVSRKPGPEQISYEEMNDLLSDYNLIINATPVGMFPSIEEAPEVDYDKLTPNHICYDLIYNPEKTLFLKKAEKRGAKIFNGYKMLINQANLAWDIWKNRE